MSADLVLYSSSISNASARLRIALNLKDLPYKLININLSKNEQYDPDFLAQSASGTVPLLVHRHDDHSPDTVIGQSIAALEYLEEAFPETRRLQPHDPASRAVIRTLVALLASDTHPLLTHRVSKAVSEMNPKEDIIVWHKSWLSQGFLKFEKMLQERSGAAAYCVGDEITHADVVLMPEAWYARRIGLDMDAFPLINSICSHVCKIEAIRKEEQTLE